MEAHAFRAMWGYLGGSIRSSGGAKKMDENAELKFKGLMDIWIASLRLLGAANATGALAAGAAFQAFDNSL
jgi:hypothetical protein